MRKFCVSLLAFFAVSTMTAGTSTSLEYHLTITEPQTHYAKVRMLIKNYTGKSIQFKIPVWTPGSYMLREFEKNVEGVEAKNNGKIVSLKHSDKNTWILEKIAPGEIEFSYSVYAFEFSVRTSFIDASHAFLHNTSIFMYAEELKSLPGHVHLSYPGAWKKISTSLEAAKETNTFTFADYDELADSPIEIGNHEEYGFDVAGVPHIIAMVGPHNADTKKFVDDLQKICTTMTHIVGEHPCKKYVFIVQNAENPGGGLEHKNSCTVLMQRWSYIDPVKYKNNLELCAHEYFHLWNVKRIRPIELGPFNYSQENYTRQLWVAEGITSYYDRLSLMRSGFTSVNDFINDMESEINYVENQPGTRVQALSESSFDAWVKEYKRSENPNSKNAIISYYNKGSLVAMLLDIKIASQTQGSKNLDDLMKLLYTRFYKEKKRGFSELEFIQAANEVAGTDLTAFFQKLLNTTEVPDYDEILEPTGIQTKVYRDGKNELGITTALENGRTIIKTITRNSSAWNGGLNTGDELISINGTRVNNDADQIIKNIGNPGIITAIISRSGLVSELTFNLVPLQTVRYDLVPPVEGAANKIFAKWLSK